jgi:SAM-dependent methyltransferase
VSRLLAAIYDRLMKETEAACLSSWRPALLAPLAGDVLEVGAGTGANLAYYPSAVRRLVLSEPDAAMRKRLAQHAAGRGQLPIANPGAVPGAIPGAIPTEILDAGAERLPFADATFDAVVCTLVLCSVRDPHAALAEIHRVLKPGGRLVFIEHVAADEHSSRYRWQRRFEPLWKRLMGNCHVTRHTEAAIVDAGFTLGEVQRESLRKAIPIARPSVRGVALR